jgi:L-alanine-DL-glutamate epimerase-like enolase superfamily enzyme
MDAIDGNGNVTVPDLPGLGVTFDWGYIEAHRTGRAVYD